MRILCTLCLLGLLMNACSDKKASEEDRENASSQEKDTLHYQNPVLDMDFPDPTVIKAPDGYYYAYATRARHEGKMINIQVARSEDLVHWEYLGEALPEKPTWASATRDFWAPHVLYDPARKQYYMYFSGESDAEKTGKCLGVAVSDQPQGPFHDKGEPLLCGEGFENIDPMAFDDPQTGKKLLYWGSGFKPLKVRELTNDRLSFKSGTSARELVAPGKEKEYTNLLEGSWVIFRDGHYYLFYSGDNCCGEKAHYAVMVARADSAMGPFQRMGEANGTGSSVILEEKDYWEAPGHNSVITDEAGNDWIFYHAINPESRWKPENDQDKENRQIYRIMLMDRIQYENGWPVIAGKRPSVEKQPGPVTGQASHQ